jgi:spore maturation protein CgeB
MRVVMFYHSLASDWNHGNAHFLRGVVTELLARGHDVQVYEPRGGWSASNLVADAGPDALTMYQEAYPELKSHIYDPPTPDLDRVLHSADLVLVHEWNEPELVAALGHHHRNHPAYRLLFHDTHHRSITDPRAIGRYDLSGYDGVLAFGEVIARTYLSNGWARAAWTWHEAADTRVFHPLPNVAPVEDLIWIGNWGDDERTEELREFLLEPVKQLGLRACVYGVRYPDAARRALADAGIRYGGWLPNHRVPEALARCRVTVHVPRRPYVQALPGIPTIRVFEALACGVPLVTSPWSDSEGLFHPGVDFLVANHGKEMTAQLRRLLENPPLRRALAEQGRGTILARHTCGHRVDQLMEICDSLDLDTESPRRRDAAEGVVAHG